MRQKLPEKEDYGPIVHLNRLECILCAVYTIDTCQLFGSSAPVFDDNPLRVSQFHFVSSNIKVTIKSSKTRTHFLKARSENKDNFIIFYLI